MRKVRRDLNIDWIHNKGIRGKNIGVAVLDSGISGHPDFENRIKVFKDFVDRENKMYDDEGHGTHVTGIIAGSGNISKGIMTGIAPEADIISIRVLDKKGIGKEENVINGIKWIIDNGKRYGIRVVNISFGTLKKNESDNNKLTEMVELLWDLGYVVVAAAGNSGPGPSSISTPGDSKKIITVGADNDNVRMMVNGKMVYNYSGRGPTKQCIQKPDIVAPANGIYSCCNLWKKNYFYVQKSGTSMSTPIVSGIICLMLSVNPKLTNVQCKKIIKETANDLNMDKNRQGWGKVSAQKAIEKANASLLWNTF